jgi:hypothetical protein
MPWNISKPEDWGEDEKSSRAKIHFVTAESSTYLSSTATHHILENKKNIDYDHDHGKNPHTTKYRSSLTEACSTFFVLRYLKQNK